MTTVEEIKRLLQRNKRRLYKELHQSKEAMFLIRKSYRGMDEFTLIIIVKYDSSNGQIFNKKQMIRILMRK